MHVITTCILLSQHMCTIIMYAHNNNNCNFQLLFHIVVQLHRDVGLIRSSPVWVFITAKRNYREKPLTLSKNLDSIPLDASRFMWNFWRGDMHPRSACFAWRSAFLMKPSSATNPWKSLVYPATHWLWKSYQCTNPTTQKLIHGPYSLTRAFLSAGIPNTTIICDAAKC